MSLKAKRPKRYLVWGYYGHGNLGDELMLKVIAGKLTEIDPDSEIYVRCYDAPRVKGVISFPVEKPVINLPFIRHLIYIARILFAISKIDILVIGGGTLFLDKGHFNQSMHLLNITVSFAKSLKKKVLVIGAGIDILECAKNIENLRNIFNKSDRIFLRDNFSYNMALSMTNGYKEKVYKSSDILFDAGYVESLKRNVTIEKNVIVVSLSDYYKTWGSYHDRQRLMNSSCILVERLLALYGEKYRILLAAFQKDTGERDYEFLLDIMNMVIAADRRYEDRIYLEYVVTEDQIKAIFASAAFIVSMRYHALVLGAIFMKPFFGINIESKIREICLDFGMPFIDASNFLDKSIDEPGLSSLIGRTVDEDKLKEQILLSKTNFDWVAPA